MINNLQEKNSLNCSRCFMRGKNMKQKVKKKLNKRWNKIEGFDLLAPY